MIVKVRQVGDTLVVTIPKAIAKYVGIVKGQQIAINSGTPLKDASDGENIVYLCVYKPRKRR